MANIYAVQLWITVEADSTEEAERKASDAAHDVCKAQGTLEAAEPAYEVCSVVQVADERVKVEDLEVGQ